MAISINIKPTCFKCGVNGGGPKKFRFLCKGSLVKHLCRACIDELGNAREALAWANNKIEQEHLYNWKVTK